jgi:hypothetical protein
VFGQAKEIRSWGVIALHQATIRSATAMHAVVRAHWFSLNYSQLESWIQAIKSINSSFINEI